MREALRLARAGTGATYPNPCVGAVVVRAVLQAQRRQQGLEAASQARQLVGMPRWGGGHSAQGAGVEALAEQDVDLAAVRIRSRASGDSPRHRSGQVGVLEAALRQPGFALLGADQVTLVAPRGQGRVDIGARF